MGKYLYGIIGACFILLSAILYTLERITAKISASIVAAGFASHGIGADPAPKYPEFFDNFFVAFFLIGGLALLAYDSLRKR